MMILKKKIGLIRYILEKFDKFIRGKHSIYILLRKSRTIRMIYRILSYKDLKYKYKTMSIKDKIVFKEMYFLMAKHCKFKKIGSKINTVMKIPQKQQCKSLK